MTHLRLSETQIFQKLSHPLGLLLSLLCFGFEPGGGRGGGWEEAKKEALISWEASQNLDLLSTSSCVSQSEAPPQPPLGFLLWHLPSYWLIQLINQSEPGVTGGRPRGDWEGAILLLSIAIAHLSSQNSNVLKTNVYTVTKCFVCDIFKDVLVLNVHSFL